MRRAAQDCAKQLLSVPCDDPPASPRVIWQSVRSMQCSFSLVALTTTARSTQRCDRKSLFVPALSLAHAPLCSDPTDVMHRVAAWIGDAGSGLCRVIPKTVGAFPC